VAEAIPEMRAALQMNPDDVSAKYHLAFSLVQTGEKTEGMTLLQQVVTQDKNYADAYYQIGKLQLEQGDVKTAIGNLETATQLSPSSEYMHYQLAQAYRRDARAEDAARELKLYQHLKDSRRGSHEQQAN
jgi:Flp pilus assembly protein TadD